MKQHSRSRNQTVCAVAESFRQKPIKMKHDLSAMEDVFHSQVFHEFFVSQAGQACPINLPEGEANGTPECI